MKAWVIHEADGPERLQLEDIPTPSPKPGWCLIRIRAFGLNRSEYFTRIGDSPSVGGYAEYTLVPHQCVLPFNSDLPWEEVVAYPEMLQTTHGSLHIGLEIDRAKSLLIRGGTSSIGMAALAKQSNTLY